MAEPVEADREPEAPETEPQPPSPTSRRSRRASAGSSPGSSAAADPFFADAGAGFDPEKADEAEEELGGEPDAAELVLWTPERIRRVLELQGQLTHSVAGVAEQDWLWLPRELDLVCGPLADHCNRVPALAALAHLSDDAAIAAGFVSYATRSWLERTRELQRRKAEQAPRPVTGRAAEPVDVDPEEVTWTTPT